MTTQMKENQDTNKYTDDFYQRIVEGSHKSGLNTLGFLRKNYIFDSVADYGCGYGSWLIAARDLGVSKIQGYDGNWIDSSKLAANRIPFEQLDINAPFKHQGGLFDLAISLEVGEHVSNRNDDDLIDALCSLSHVVLFGAAIVNQSGTDHINCQPQSYWVRKFKDRGYEAIDAIRPHIWNSREVHWWYRQNAILYVKTNGVSEELREKLRSLQNPVWDLVHPEHLQLKWDLYFNPSFRNVVGSIKNFLGLR